VRPHVKERSRIVSYVGIRSCIFTRLKPQNMELLCSNLPFYRRTACMPLGKRLQENVHSEQKKKKYGGEVWQSARRAGGWGEKNKANSTVELTSLPRRSIASPGCTFCSSSVSRAHTASLDKKKDKTKKEVLRSSAACENRVSIHLSRLLDVQAAAQPARKRSLTYSQLLLRRGRSRHSILEDD